MALHQPDQGVEVLGGAIPDSSTTMLVPAGIRHAGGGPSGFRCSWSSLASVVAGQPVSMASTSAALPEGASPTADRRWLRRRAAAAPSIVVLPTPAGPTTSTSCSSPLTAWTAAAGGSSPVGGIEPTADRAQASNRASWFSTPGALRRRSVTCSRRGRPSLRQGAPAGAAGCSSTQRAAAASARRSTKRTASVAEPLVSAGRRAAISLARSARSQVEEDAARASRAWVIMASTSTATFPGNGRWPPGSDSGSKPPARARSVHSDRRVSASTASCLSGRLSSTAQRSSR